MWFKELENEKTFRELFLETRPLMSEYCEAVGKKRVCTDSQLLMAHYSYFMRIDEIDTESQLPQKPTCLRVFESDATGPIAVYEVSLNEKKPELFQLNLEEKCFRYFENAVNTLKENDNNSGTGEIRHLRVTALNLEAVWLHDELKGDKFARLQYLDKPPQIHTEKEFVALLNTMKKKLGKIGDKSGT